VSGSLATTDPIITVVKNVSVQGCEELCRSYVLAAALGLLYAPRSTLEHILVTGGRAVKGGYRAF
jgi:hypothetical protein